MWFVNGERFGRMGLLVVVFDFVLLVGVDG